MVLMRATLAYADFTVYIFLRLFWKTSQQTFEEKPASQRFYIKASQ